MGRVPGGCPEGGKVEKPGGDDEETGVGKVFLLEQGPSNVKGITTCSSTVL